MKDLLKRMIPNPLRLAFKMFGLVWFVLILHILLKITFDYWQPYVIPNDKLENLGNFIDSHRWLQATLNGIFYLINGIFVILCCLQQWWFKSKKETIIVISCLIVGFIFVANGITDIPTLLLSLLLPLIINRKKWLWTILTFANSNLFLALSFFLEGFTNVDVLNFIIGTFMQFDYYIMLILNYILFNMIRIKKELKNMGERFFFAWFGGKQIEELKAIKETQWETLTEEQRKELDYAIALQEGK